MWCIIMRLGTRIVTWVYIHVISSSSLIYDQSRLNSSRAQSTSGSRSVSVIAFPSFLVSNSHGPCTETRIINHQVRMMASKGKKVQRVPVTDLPSDVQVDKSRLKFIGELILIIVHAYIISELLKILLSIWPIPSSEEYTVVKGNMKAKTLSALKTHNDN